MISSRSPSSLIWFWLLSFTLMLLSYSLLLRASVGFGTKVAFHVRAVCVLHVRMGMKQGQTPVCSSLQRFTPIMVVSKYRESIKNLK